MRLSATALALTTILAASTAQAHVRILPNESQVGARQTYTVRVPTEGKVATTSVEVEVPDGVSVISAQGAAEMHKAGGRTVSLTWKVEIPPGESQELTFTAINPADRPQIVWKAHQRYVDGSTSEWVNMPPNPTPASITKLHASAS